MITAFSLTSCDYLDVVPPEQPNIDDVKAPHQSFLGFLYSCYGRRRYRFTFRLSGRNKFYDRRIRTSVFMEHRWLLGRICFQYRIIY